MLRTCEEHDDCIVVHDTSDCPFCGAVKSAGQMETELRAEKQSLENDLEDAHYNAMDDDFKESKNGTQESRV